MWRGKTRTLGPLITLWLAASGVVLWALFSRYGLYLYLPLASLALIAGLVDHPPFHGWEGIIGLTAAAVAAGPWTLLALSNAFTNFSGRFTDEQAFWLLWSFIGLNVSWCLGNTVLRRRAQAAGAESPTMSLASRTGTAAYIALWWLLGSIVAGVVFSLASAGIGGAVASVSSAVYVGLISAALHCACVILFPARVALSLASAVLVAVVAFTASYVSFPYVYEQLDSFLGSLFPLSAIDLSPPRLLLMAFLASQIVFWGADRFLKRLPAYLPALFLGWAVILASYSSIVATALHIWRVRQPERLSEIDYVAQHRGTKAPNSGSQDDAPQAART